MEAYGTYYEKSNSLLSLLLCFSQSKNRGRFSNQDKSPLFLGKEFTTQQKRHIEMEQQQREQQPRDNPIVKQSGRNPSSRCKLNKSNCKVQNLIHCCSTTLQKQFYMGGETQRREFDHPPLFRAFHSSFLNPPFQKRVASGKTFSSEATLRFNALFQ